MSARHINMSLTINDVLCKYSLFEDAIETAVVGQSSDEIILSTLIINMTISSVFVRHCYNNMSKEAVERK
jgi:hypothetical protein